MLVLVRWFPSFIVVLTDFDARRLCGGSTIAFGICTLSTIETHAFPLQRQMCKLDFFCKMLFFSLVFFPSVLCIANVHSLSEPNCDRLSETVTATLTLTCSTCSHWLRCRCAMVFIFLSCSMAFPASTISSFLIFVESFVRSLVRVYTYHWVTGALEDVFLRNRPNFFRCFFSSFLFYRLINFIYVFMSNVAWNLLHTTTLVLHWRFECVTTEFVDAGNGTTAKCTLYSVQCTSSFTRSRLLAYASHHIPAISPTILTHFSLSPIPIRFFISIIFSNSIFFLFILLYFSFFCFCLFIIYMEKRIFL